MIRNIVKLVAVIGIAVFVKLVLLDEDHPIKSLNMSLLRQVEMKEGALLNPKTGELKLSGWSKEVTRHLVMDDIVPGILGNKSFTWMKFKRGMIYSIMNDEIALIFTMVDKSYMAEFNFYQYEFNNKKFRTHKEWFFYGQYPRISDDFAYWKGSYQLSTSRFEVNIQDEDKGDKFERTFKWKMNSIDLDVDAVFVKSKNLEGSFQAMPLYFDKRYWHRSYDQMNLVVYGEAKLSPTKSFPITAGKDFRGIFNDWRGVYGYKTFVIQSWWQLPANVADRQGDIHPKLSLHTAHGLIHGNNNRVETDIMYDTDQARRMEPILQWPDRHDRMSEWIYQTNKHTYLSQMIYNGFFRPDYQHHDKLDLGFTLSDSKIYFGSTNISSLTLTRDWKEKDEVISNNHASGFVMELYNHW